jgi:hypothetical protein
MSIESRTGASGPVFLAERIGEGAYALRTRPLPLRQAHAAE